MRELLYLSERKLRQFTSPRLRRIASPFEAEGEVSTPIAKIRIGRKPSRQGITPEAYLEKVVAELEASDRAPKWYEDETVQAGDWIHFEDRMNYSLMPEQTFNSAVVFTMCPSRHKNTDPQLVLHGSPDHLLDSIKGSPASSKSALPTDIDLAGHNVALYKEQAGGGQSGGGWVYDTSVYRAFSAQQKKALGKAARLLGDSDEDAESPKQTYSSMKPLDPLAKAIRYFHEHLRSQASSIDSAEMAGYARVTAVVPWDEDDGNVVKIAVASPLYVEYVTSDWD